MAPRIVETAGNETDSAERVPVPPPDILLNVADQVIQEPADAIPLGGGVLQAEEVNQNHGNLMIPDNLRLRENAIPPLPEDPSETLRGIKLNDNVTPCNWNSLMNGLGVHGVKFLEVSFDDEMLESTPTTHLGLILCVPRCDALEYWQQCEENKKNGIKLEDKAVFLMKKSEEGGIADGTFALFHFLANLDGQINLGDGSFAKWLAEAKKVGVEERYDLLANNAELASIHSAAATGGETAPVGDVEHHFICYVRKNDTLYEIDSRRPFAREVGPTSEATLVKDAGAACQHLIEKLDNVSFSAIALVKTG